MRADRRVQSPRLQELSLANLLRGAKAPACPPLLRSYDKLAEKNMLFDK